MASNTLPWPCCSLLMVVLYEEFCKVVPPELSSSLFQLSARIRWRPHAGRHTVQLLRYVLGVAMLSLVFTYMGRTVENPREVAFHTIRQCWWNPYFQGDNKWWHMNRKTGSLYHSDYLMNLVFRMTLFSPVELFPVTVTYCHYACP